MKKTLILTGLMAFIFGAAAFAAEPAKTMPAKGCPVKGECPKAKDGKDGKKCEADKEARRNAIDERLNLTEDQKTKAKELRMQGHEKIKPIVTQIKAKKAEIEAIKACNLTQEETDKKIAPLKADLQKLKAEAKKIREQNMKEFEAILTPEQKTEFAKMKEEGKARHEARKKGDCPKGEFSKKDCNKNCVKETPKK